MADIETHQEVKSMVSVNVAGNGQDSDIKRIEISRLPFSFAKRHSVLISKVDNQYTLHCLNNVNSAAVLEVRRVLKTT